MQAIFFFCRGSSHLILSINDVKPNFNKRLLTLALFCANVAELYGQFDASLYCFLTRFRRLILRKNKINELDMV